LCELLEGDGTFKWKILVPTMTARGILFLCALRLPGRDGKLHTCALSEQNGLALSRQGWRRVAADMDSRSRDCCLATASIAGKLKDPRWPNKTINELISSAFEGRFIEDLNHPAIQHLGVLS